MPTPSGRASGAAPTVAVLLATHNGLRWLPAQLDSILTQDGISVRVIALDDESTDGTHGWLLEQSKKDPRITVLPAQGSSGSAAANFYRLIRQADIASDELVAFADQDDLWLPEKLSRHAALIALGADGVSSDVTAVLADGNRVLIRKSYPQRTFDYLLESPGPGSTFLLTFRLFSLVKKMLEETQGLAESITYHDWLIYAVARARGYTWTIDPKPSVDYLQHESNTMGANVGIKSATRRLSLMRKRWHRGQAILLAQLGLTVADENLRPELTRMLDLLNAAGMRARWKLAVRANQLRRRPRDQKIIAVLIAIGAW